MGFTRVMMEWTSAGDPIFTSPDDCLHSQPHTRLFVTGANTPVGIGTLYILSHHVLWTPTDRPSTERGIGYQVEYFELLMHAVSRESEDFPHTSLYCQVEQPEDAEEEEEEEGERVDEDGQPSAVTATVDGGGGQQHGSEGEGEGDPIVRAGELRFVPEDPAAVELLYRKMSEGAELNPDEEQAAEGEGDFFFDSESLQVAPGVDVHALLSGAGEMEHEGEEFYDDEDEEGEELEEGEEGVEVEGLEVTCHRVTLSPRTHGEQAMEEDHRGSEDEVEESGEG